MKRIIAWVACALALGVAFTALSGRMSRAERRLTEVYQAALDEACEALGEMELTLEKLLVSADGAQEAALLSALSQAAAGVQRSLAVLPVRHDALRETVSFANRVAGYADALLYGAALTGSLSAFDTAQLKEELAACARLGSELLLARQEIAVNASAFPIEDAGDAYPVLRYSGRYGDAQLTPALREEDDISQARAVQLARELFDPARLVATEYQRTSAGPLAAHEVTVVLRDLTLDAAFTVSGGHLLWLMPRRAGFAQALSEEECAQSAAAFLDAQGFGPMTPVWQERYDGMAVCTFAAVQEDVTLYADLVRVQVRMDTGEIVGVEASPYWRYHTARALPSPALSAAQAAALVSPEAEIVGHRLCLAPLYGEERLCYEFRAVRAGETYLIFLDAQTGRETLIRKLVQTAGGTRPA